MFTLADSDEPQSPQWKWGGYGRGGRGYGRGGRGRGDHDHGGEY